MVPSSESRGVKSKIASSAAFIRSSWKHSKGRIAFITEYTVDKRVFLAFPATRPKENHLGSAGFTDISTHAGANPLFRALRTEGKLDQAAQ